MGTIMKWFKREEIESALDKEKRQYLVGNLAFPQFLMNRIKGDIEIGISYYEYFTADKPHVHPVCTDYSYVLDGQVKIMLLDGSMETHTFNKGDFYMIPPGQPHVTKNCEGTKILFIKSPGMNDKTIVDVGQDVLDWLSKW